MTTGRFQIHVAGVTYNNDDGTSRQVVIRLCKNGDKLVLFHTPFEQDVNAVKVCRECGEQLGWLPAEIAKEIAPYLAKGQNIECEIVEKTRFAGNDGKMKWGCRIQITKPEYHEAVNKRFSRGCLIAGIVIIAFIVLIVVGLITCLS